MTSYVAKSGLLAIAATRSVPEGCRGSDSRHSAPASRAARATSSLSVAITTRSASARPVRRSQTRTTRGTPPRRRSGLRGSRVAPRRAGITARVVTESEEARAALQDSHHEYIANGSKRQTSRSLRARCATLHADRAAGDRRAPAAQNAAVQIRRAEDSIAALAQAALHGLERETTPLAIHVHGRESLRQHAHAPS